MAEKIVAIKLLYYYKKFAKLHLGQIGAQKQQHAINTIVSLVYKVQEC